MRGSCAHKRAPARACMFVCVRARARVCVRACAISVAQEICNNALRNLQQCAIAARVKPLARVRTVYAMRARIPPSATLFATLFATRVYPAAARAALRASELERAAAARSAQLGVPPSAGRICARNARVYSRAYCARARALFAYKMCAHRPALCIRRTGPPVHACLCARSHARARTKCERAHARRRRVPAAFPHPHPPQYTPLARFGGA